MDVERYSRQIMLPEIGNDGQRRIKDASVLIVGLGGLGSAVSLYLTGAGIGRIGLADNDVVSLSNLQRQVLYSEADLGKQKTDAACRRLSAQSAETEFEIFPEGLNDGNAFDIIHRFDIVVDCCDNYPTRFLIDDVCRRAEVPWVYGSIGAFSGQVSVFNYHSGTRYSDLYEQKEDLCKRPKTLTGVIGVVPGLIGTIQATEVIKMIAGFGDILDGKLFMIDVRTLETQIIFV